MNLPWPSVTPEAVRISVSMRSLITVALAGMTLASSLSDACRQEGGIGRAQVDADKIRSIKSARTFRIIGGSIFNRTPIRVPILQHCIRSALRLQTNRADRLLFPTRP